VRQWLGNINLPDHVAAHFEEQDILGKDLRALNDTARAFRTTLDSN